MSVISCCTTSSRLTTWPNFRDERAVCWVDTPARLVDISRRQIGRIVGLLPRVTTKANVLKGMDAKLRGCSTQTRAMLAEPPTLQETRNVLLAPAQACDHRMCGARSLVRRFIRRRRRPLAWSGQPGSSRYRYHRIRPMHQWCRQSLRVGVPKVDIGDGRRTGHSIRECFHSRRWDGLREPGSLVDLRYHDRHHRIVRP